MSEPRPRPAPPRLLLVEPEDAARQGLVRLLEIEGYPVEGVRDGEEALRRAARVRPDIVLTADRLPGLSGLDLIDGLRDRHFTGPVLVLAALPDVERAVLAVRRGADDYLAKPVDLERLLARLAELGSELHQEGRTGRARIPEGHKLVGSAPSMLRLVESIRTAAMSSASVLVLGETGTGKELVARLVHEWSERRDRPFLPLHCAALAEGVLESELFGHEKGAFTGAIRERQGRFELADTGTLFLDEVGEMGPGVQVKLLRVLEDGTFERVGGSRTHAVDVRLVSATNRDLVAEVEEGAFREDLFYRLNVITLRIPPLRERRGDIPLLARTFLQKYAEKYGKRLLGFTREALEALSAAPWPGNVRELESTVERAVVFARGHRIELRSLPSAFRKAVDVAHGMISVPLGTSLKDAERELILRTLETCDNNRSRAARMLGISDRKIRYKLKEWGSR